MNPALIPYWQEQVGPRAPGVVGRPVASVVPAIAMPPEESTAIAVPIVEP